MCVAHGYAADKPTIEKTKKLGVTETTHMLDQG